MAEQTSPQQRPLLRNLQFSPLKEGEEQYVVLWDPSGLSAERLIVPLNYFYLFQFFDGEHSLDQIAGQYLKKFGEFFMPDRLGKLVADLDAKLFLEGERVEAARRAADEAYRAMPLRKPVYAGKSYESDGQKLQAQIDGFYSSPEGPEINPSANKGKRLRGLVAPHHEMKQAGPVYAWAYKEMKDAEIPELFVIFGTCHAGLKNAFAVTEKDFETPLGVLPVDREIVGLFRQKGGAPFFEEERSHQNEHSIEFQLPFLQHAVAGRRAITILPVLCVFPPACFADPELRDLGAMVQKFLSVMSDTLAECGKDVCFIASAELAHIGMRYGDSQPPSDFSFHKCMQADLAMLKHAENLEAGAFAQFILKEGDTRRISGFAAMYTLLKLIKAEKGQVLRYDRGITDQFNSTVTYASMAFF
jgi:AmmeMemoRadiSam system protein B